MASCPYGPVGLFYRYLQAFSDEPAIIRVECHSTMLKKEILAALFLVLATTVLLAGTVTTTIASVYAQQQLQLKQSKACPSGFTLNKGVCQADPTYACPEVPNQDTAHVVGNKCFYSESASPACRPTSATDMTQYYYDIFTDKCLIAGTKDPAPPGAEEMYCGQYEALGWTLQRFHNRWQCVHETSVDAVPTCTTGILNSDTGKCEVKPGNRK